MQEGPLYLVKNDPRHFWKGNVMLRAEFGLLFSIVLYAIPKTRLIFHDVLLAGIVATLLVAIYELSYFNTLELYEDRLEIKSWTGRSRIISLNNLDHLEMRFGHGSTWTWIRFNLKKGMRKIEVNHNFKEAMLEPIFRDLSDKGINVLIS